MEHHRTGDSTPTGQNKKQVEEDNHDKIYSDEDFPTNEPREKLYKITKIVYLRPKDEDEWEEELNRQQVLVGGKIYGPDEWNYPAWRSLKGTLPPWIRDRGVVDTKEFKNWVPHPGGVGVNLRAIYLAEAKRIENNKGYTLFFLEETEDIKIISEPWDEVESQTRSQQQADSDVHAVTG